MYRNNDRKRHIHVPIYVSACRLNTFFSFIDIEKIIVIIKTQRRNKNQNIFKYTYYIVLQRFIGDLGPSPQQPLISIYFFP